MKNFLARITKVRLLLYVIVALVGILMLAGVFLMSNTYLPTENAKNSLKSTNHILVENNSEGIIFSQPGVNEEKAYIFYPGGLVDAESYAPFCAEVAARGFLCIIVKMPLNLAIFGINNADKFISKYDKIKSWYIGGHSLGGPMAARYIQTGSSKIVGLFLLASYSDVDISSKNIKVISLRGTKDSVLNNEQAVNYRKNLPSATTYIDIQGGNHSQFGSYGLQKNDTPADINERIQLIQTVNAILESE